MGIILLISCSERLLRRLIMGSKLVYAVLLSLLGTSFSSTVDNIIDIGHYLDPEAPVLPYEGVEPFQLEVVYRDFLETGWLAANRFTFTTYTGTDLEAPFLTFETGWKVNEIPQEHFFGEVSVIDVSEMVEEDPDYQVSEEDVDKWISLNGQFPNNSVILFRTGWDKKYTTTEEYFGVPPNLTFPTVSEDATRKIISIAKEEKLNIYGFGIDSGHVDKPEGDYTVHQLLASRNMYILQNLKDLDLVPATGARIMVAPMKVRGASGVPTRVMINLPEYHNYKTKYASKYPGKY